MFAVKLLSATLALTAVWATEDGGYGGAAGGGTCRGREANPSVYNFEIGGYNAKVISDGRLLFQPEDTFQDDPFLITRALEKNFQSADPVVFDNNVLYVEWEDDKILFDTGNSFLRPDTAGWLHNQLHTEGISPDSITKIFINHGHFDHVAGLIENEDSEGPYFPNADIYIAQEEVDFFTGPNPTFGPGNDLDDESRAFLIDSFVLVYEKVKDKVRTFPSGAEDIIPGITSYPCTYHTPGSVAYILTPPNGGEPFFYAGDCIGIESVTVNNQFRLRFDTFVDEGAAGRAKILDWMAEKRIKSLMFHDSFPGIGYIVPNDLTWDVKRVNWEYSEAVETTCPV